MPPLAPRVQEQVQLQRWSRPGTAWKERGHQVQGQAVEVLSQQEPEPHVAVGHQRERGEEVLAELPVRHPRPALHEVFERERVDQDRAPAVELHVVRGGVAERHPVIHRRRLHAQREERRIAQLGEAPLVRIGDERHELGTQHAGGPPFSGQRRVLLVRDQESGVVKGRSQARGLEPPEVLGRRRVDVAVQDAVAAEDVAARVAERTGDRVVGVGHRRNLGVRRRARRVTSRDA